MKTAVMTSYVISQHEQFIEAIDFNFDDRDFKHDCCRTF